MFQILTQREERSSVATATNLPFSEWGMIVPDARLVAAIIDRLTFTRTSSKPVPIATACAPRRPCALASYDSESDR